MSEPSQLDPMFAVDPARILLASEAAAAAQPPAPAYGYGSNVLGETEVHLRDYVKVLYKRRWTALTVFLVVALSVSVYTFTATPIYEGRVQILIEKEATNVVTFKEAIEQNRVTDDYDQTQYNPPCQAHADSLEPVGSSSVQSQAWEFPGRSQHPDVAGCFRVELV